MDIHLRKKARKALKDKDVMDRLLEEAAVKAERNRSKLAGVWENLKALFRLILAWFDGRYPDLPWRSLIVATGAILYFVNPLDAIPDFLIVGLADDALLIGWVVAAIRKDLEKFLLWEKTIPAQVVDGGRSVH